MGVVVAQPLHDVAQVGLVSFELDLVQLAGTGDLQIVQPDVPVHDVGPLADHPLFEMAQQVAAVLRVRFRIDDDRAPLELARDDRAVADPDGVADQKDLRERLRGLRRKRGSKRGEQRKAQRQHSAENRHTRFLLRNRFPVKQTSKRVGCIVLRRMCLLK
jgi:hypothetical protein